MSALDEGMDAFERGKRRTACPYEEGSDDAEEWLAGWDEGKSLREDEGSEDGDEE